MTKMNRTTLFALSLSAVLLLPAGARADWRETFSKNDVVKSAGEYHGNVEWHLETFSALCLEPSATATFKVENNQLIFSDPVEGVRPSPNPPGYTRWAGTICAFGWVDNVFQDVLVAGAVNTTPTEGFQSQGLMARWDKGNNYYWFRIRFDTGEYGIVRSKYFGSFEKFPESVGRVTDFDPKKAYYLELKLVGGDMEGWVYELPDKWRVSPLGFYKGRLVGHTGKVKDPDPHLEGVSGALMEAEGEVDSEAPTATYEPITGMPLAGSVAIVSSTAIRKTVQSWNEALRQDPNSPHTRLGLARALASEGKYGDAAGHYAEALKLRPDYVEAMSELAWIRATNPDPQVRNPQEAVALAERLVELTHYVQRRVWSDNYKINSASTFAAAQAAAGNYKRALDYARLALELAQNPFEKDEPGRAQMIQELKQRLQLYESHKPYVGLRGPVGQAPEYGL